HKILGAFNDTFTKESMGIVDTGDIPTVLHQKGRRTIPPTFLDEYSRTFARTNEHGTRERKTMNETQHRKRGTCDEWRAVLLCIDRYGAIGARKRRKGRITIESVRRVFNNDIFERLNDGNIMVTDGSTAYKKVFEAKAIGHEVLTSRNNERVRGFYHLNTLN